MTSFNSIRTAVRIVVLGGAVLSAGTFASASGLTGYEQITNTGAQSLNTVVANINQQMQQTVANVGSATTDFGALVSTGGNTNNKNTFSGGSMGGDVDLGGSIENVVNPTPVFTPVVTSAAAMDSFGSAINTTGADSTNEVDRTINRQIVNNVVNSANVSTTGTLVANTGDNESDQNTTTGLSSSGDVTGDLNISNVANGGAAAQSASSSSTAAAPSISDVTSIGQTGFGSANTTTLNSNYSDVTNTTNSGTANTGLSIVANTGDNKNNQNTTSAGQKSGSVNVHFTVSNKVN
jgi:hypothetical protein